MRFSLIRSLGKAIYQVGKSYVDQLDARKSLNLYFIKNFKIEYIITIPVIKCIKIFYNICFNQSESRS